LEGPSICINKKRLPKFFNKKRQPPEVEDKRAVEYNKFSLFLDKISKMAETKNDKLENEMDEIINERVMQKYEEKKKTKAAGFKRLKPKAKTPDNKLKGSFSIFKEKPKKEGGAASPAPSPAPPSVAAESVKDEDEMAVIPVEEGEGGEEGEEGEAVGVEVDEEDDWKQMVIKTRLKLKECKDMIMGGQEGLTEDERTKKTKFVINEEKMLDVHFRLDFTHTTPIPSEFSDVDDSDFEEIKPNLEGLETPDEEQVEETEKRKKKRLKRRDKAMKKCAKLNEKREARLKEKRRIRAIEKAEIAAAEAEALDAAEGSESGSKKYSLDDEKLDKLKLSGDEAEGEEGEEEEVDPRSWYEKLQDDSGIRIIINTDGLNEKWEAQKVILQEYKEIFFGPDLTPEEIAELEKIEKDDKHFTIHLKFIIRKKTKEEKEEERLAAEEEARRKAIENGEIVEGEEGNSSDENNVLHETDERKEERRKEMEKEEGESPTTPIDFEAVQI